MIGRRENSTRLKAAALAALSDLVQQWLPGGEQRGNVYVVLNPLCNDRNLGSFQINTQTGRWRDHAIGVGGGDAISLYAYLQTGGDYRLAFVALSHDPLVRAAIATGATAPPAKAANPLKSPAAKLALVRQQYGDAVPVASMPAATYLHSRGLRPTDAWGRLRASVLHYPGRGRYPALIAPIDGPGGSLVGLHRTYLTPAGTKADVPSPRRTLGQVRGGAIRLGTVGDQLIVCEGLEDGLTLYQVLGIPVWVACGAGFMRTMAIPDTVRTLIIAADDDPIGARAAQQAADAHNIGGRSVDVMRPSPGHKDFNDELRGIRHDK